MTRSHLTPILLRLGLLVVAITVAFVLLQDVVRPIEARWAVDLVRAFGGHNVYDFGTGSILVSPANSSAFVAVVTPTCSSLAAVLALLCLGAVMKTGTPARRVFAVLAAILVVVVGNLLRISAAIAVGLVAGRDSLVLFHDAAGTIFTFVYILGGYMMMLFILLPKTATRAPSPSLA